MLQPTQSLGTSVSASPALDVGTPPDAVHWPAGELPRAGGGDDFGTTYARTSPADATTARSEAADAPPDSGPPAPGGPTDNASVVDAPSDSSGRAEETDSSPAPDSTRRGKRRATSENGQAFGVAGPTESVDASAHTVCSAAPQGGAKGDVTPQPIISQNASTGLPLTRLHPYRGTAESNSARADAPLQSPSAGLPSAAAPTASAAAPTTAESFDSALVVRAMNLAAAEQAAHSEPLAEPAHQQDVLGANTDAVQTTPSDAWSHSFSPAHSVSAGPFASAAAPGDGYGWLSQARDVAQQVMQAALAARETTSSAHGTRVELQLRPPELGRVWIELTDTRHGVEARIVFSQESSFHVVKGDLTTLRNALEGAGVTVSEFQVSYEGQRSDKSPTDRDRDELPAVRSSTRRSAARRSARAEQAAPEPSHAAWPERRRVDLRV